MGIAGDILKPRKVLRIARWEVTKAAGEIDRRSLIIALIAFLVVGTLIPSLAQTGGNLDEGLYTVGVSEDSVYYGPVKNDSTLVAKDPSRKAFEKGNLDVLVTQNRVLYSNTSKGRAALSELRSATKDYNTRLMLKQRDVDEVAAFPVEVNLIYATQDVSLNVGGGAGGQDGEDGGARNGDGSGDGGAGNGDRSGDGGGITLPPVGGGSLFGGGNQPGTPAGITPPFPFESLILAFVFIVPMNFVIQAYASSMINERIKRRGELMLVSPVSRFDIIAGKTLPYLGAMIGITAVISVGIHTLQGNPLGTGLVSIAAVVPIVLAFLSSAFVGSMFARSFKELTFVTVFISVFLTSYVFVPAIFTDIHPISVISPITMVVKELQGTAVTISDYAFSTLPLYLTSGVLFALGSGIYREEDMFAQRPVPLKLLDAVASRIRGRPSMVKLSILFIPFVFAAELLAIAILFALPVGVSIPVLLVAIAFIEEIAKSIHVYAGFNHSLFDRSIKTAVVLGTLSGVGFFLGEKITVITQVVGLPQLDIGEAAFGMGVGAVSGGISPFLLLALLLGPLALHVITAVITSIGASRNRQYYGVALMVATLVHTTYNMTVVVVFGI
ncbi:MAG: PrsW family intramembrane metalloprotease [Halobacteria archaeon]|nr:PrsW family intramembrane metalloprotease [Halobacteria archaeon]